ncbi:MAG: helix-turn-helix domain-containing protein [Actinomycetota bacterium]|nr:helix-turn-helix domain-containing protein [Actinomycetota bacterium]
MAELITTAQVAHELKCTVDHVRVLARTGQLPSMKAGNKFLRFRRQDLDAYILSHLRHPDTAEALTEAEP